MPAIFPELQPEELLYSGIARYGDMMGFPGLTALWGNVYGQPVGSPEVDLSGPLGSLIAQMPHGTSYEARTLIREHTLFPYLTFSMSPRRRKEVEEKLDCEGSRPTGSILRTPQWKVKPPEYLQYCQSCVEEDKKNCTGTPYWRRSHQLPGVLVCPHHEEVLLATRVLRSANAGGREFTSLSRALKLEGAHELDLPSRFFEPATKIAKDSLWILQNSDLEEGDLRRRQKDWLLAFGWQHSTEPHRGEFNFKGYLEAFRNHHSSDFLSILSGGRNSLEIAEAGGWVRQLTLMYPRDRAHHPLQHILLWRFLGLSAEEFFHEPGPPVINSRIEESRVPFTQDGPCLNPACKSYDPPVPRILDVEKENEERRYTISCPSCDFTYTQQANCDDPSRIRIKQTGGVWRDRLKYLLDQDPPITMANLSEALGFGPRTIKRHAEKHGLWRSGWSRSGLRSVDHERKARMRKERGRMRNREKWLKLRQDYPNHSRSELRELSNRVAGYLSNHDTNWYKKNSPGKLRKINSKREVAWKSIDEDTIKALVRAKKEIEEEYPFSKISVKGLSERIGQVGLLYGRLRQGKLPKTKKYLDRVLESNKEYAIRRLKNRVEHYSSLRIIPSITKFKRSARIGHQYHNKNFQ